MNRFIRQLVSLELFLFYVVLLLILTSSCSNDDGPSLTETAFQQLSGDWGLGVSGQILLDGQNVTLNYPSFTLSFADGTYQTTNGADLFSASGTWQWTDNTGTLITLDTGEQLTINTLSLTEFQFSFFHAGTAPVRAGIQGNYTVKVSR
ncbi:hypothetical protein [Roseivirga sp. E12]|uniref:hypothetical protein n=1 Tax=Roseivirga sp. E12 TaxID=2819237 RepID=UPI001ABCDC25|nr:hypothetical protein [Roseivirga sp. E12]MBO3699517.1 hypothetical protein [Roseivirga sp. E12]